MTEFLSQSLRTLAPAHAPLLERLCACTAQTAEKMNITARSSAAEIVFFHVADSLSLVEKVADSKRVCDVGTGGGFPGLVLACLCPQTQFVLLDATQKKVNAIAETAKSLGLSNVTALCARAEEYGQTQGRERFDAVVSRALAALPMLSELCIPLVKTGGKFIAMKGPRYAEELEAAGPILRKLCVGAPRVISEEMSAQALLAAVDVEPSEEERAVLSEFCAMQRNTLIFEKKKTTPRAYPRAFAKIKKGGV